MGQTIELKDVFVEYDGINVLSGIDFSADDGEFIGIIGPNGGGKTTLLKVILGLIKPTKGSVKILGRSPKKARRLIGYVPQYAIFDRSFPITVEETVLMGRLGHKGWRPYFTKEDKAKAKKALEDVELLDLKDRQISKLSGGQMQRVLIARAIATDPKLLLLDEPTASIDKHMEDTIYDLLAKFTKRMTVILVTHDIGIVSSYTDRVGCLNRKLFHSGGNEITEEMLHDAYQCPVELIAHGVPHRVVHEHREEES